MHLLNELLTSWSNWSFTFH